jgi:Domain of unknown function (DUF3291)
MLAAATRLRLRSWRFLLPFMIHASRSQKQAVASPGCVGVSVRKTRGWAFWTLTVWEDEKQLRAYIGGSPHREAIPKLHPWCDEAVTVHWRLESQHMPSWEEAHRQLLQGGRLLRVQYPSQDQKAGVINLT